ncbi:uncharacterized protein LOC141593166 [Silene latifolia]|uniref:uncharacterized protein LOC141593166 n=1 Tax=Silene latifolia TaxID=37657 RepID=UPI003D76CDF0
MGKNVNQRRQQNHARRHENYAWTVKPIHDHPPSIEKKTPNFEQHEHHDHDQIYDNHGKIEQPETSFTPITKPSKGRNRKRGSKTRVEKNPGFEGKAEVGGSSFGELGSGQVVEFGESEKIEGVEVGVVKVDEEKIDKLGFEEGGGGDEDVLRGLNELEIGIDEIELSDDQVRINDQLQEDELLAMESIYGDSVYALEKRQGLRSFQFHINIELSSDYAVSTKLRIATHTNSEADVSEEFLYTFNVQYLRPIVLTCVLPRSYPSHFPPLFTISVPWLHESRISQLCSMLDSLWNEQPGQEILYHWVEWLHSSTLPYLGFDKELVLGPYVPESSSDRRAFSGRVSPDVDIPSMRSYNEERQHENFMNGLHECCICFSEYPGTEFLRMPCHHFFCVRCMKTYANVHVKEGTVNKLQCPTTKCDGMIPPGLLKRLLGDEEFERWESLMLQKTLDAMSDVAYCPRCETACLEDKDHHAQCSKCFFSFCTLCRERRHVGIECMTAEMKLRVLEDRQNSSNLRDAQKIRERELINELRSVAEILRDSKQCPSCKMAISRTEGCNKMVCTNCGNFFCYRCNKAIDGYDHFRNGKCDLFPQEMLQQWAEQLNDRQRIGQYLAVNHAGNAKLCPTCRQHNAKVGNNNHMFCWSCQTNYCYQCGQIVRRGSQHYGANRCKQHSAD